MIRVLHIVTYMGRGGLETMIMNYYRHIDRSQIQFDFLVHRDFRADYDDEIEALGGIIYRLPRLVPWSITYNKSLDAFFASHPEYKIVHVHQDCLSGVILKAAQKQGVPVRIAHSHSSSQDKNLKYLLKLFYMRQIPRYATQLFACGKEAGDWMFRGASYRVMNNAVDTKKYIYSPEMRDRMRCQLGISKDAFVVGHVGRFDPVKNHTFLIDVFACLKKKRENAILLLVGDGVMRVEMEKKVAALGIADHVVFTGVRDDVHHLMQAMDIFVFPSIYEGLGIVAIEAQAAGLPCCVADTLPDEVAITELVQFRSLEDGADQWAEWVLGRTKESRRDTLEDIQKAGYDISSTSVWLENFYRNVVENHG